MRLTAVIALLAVFFVFTSRQLSRPSLADISEPAAGTIAVEATDVAPRVIVTQGEGKSRHRETMDLETYVASVLQAEAREFQNAEALQAMAVVVRTYAVRNAHRHGQSGLCNSIHCQRLEAGPDDRMRAAAAETRGEVLWYGSQPASVFYHENCGGVTASVSNVWGGRGLPYLVSRRDPYCEREPRNWRTKIAKANLERVMASPVAESLGLPKPGLDALKLRVVGRTGSGRVSAVSWGDRVWSGTRFRELMTGMATVRSARFDIVDSGDSLTLVGRGAGHGVGLCQHGTVARAEAGDSYEEILAAYFPGTRIVREP